MNLSLKTVVLWLMLLALPLQGFAASAMACCDPEMQAHAQMAMQPMADGTDVSHVTDVPGEALDSMDSMSMPMPMPMPMHHAHAHAFADAGTGTPLAAEVHATASTLAPAVDHHAGPTSAACASCAAHCAGMAPLPIAATVAGHPAPTSGAIPFRPTASTAFVPGTPERPPQPLPV